MTPTTKARVRRRAERGGAAMIVAVLLGGGALLGAAALTVDVGNMFFERRQLQNGADATAQSLAQICAKDVTKCNASTTPTLVTGTTTMNQLNGQNANDRQASLNSTRDAVMGTVNGQCGRVPGAPNMPPCASATTDAAISDLGECPALPAWLKTATKVKYVETYTLTRTAGGTNLLPSFFQSGDGTPVGACSRMAWGPAKKTKTLPLTFAECEWKEAVTSPKGFGPAYETSLPLKYAKASEVCDTSAVPSGGDFSGGFGWLTSSIGCTAEVEAGKWVDAETGVGAGTGCISEFSPGDTIYIPIFDCISDSKTLCVVGTPTGTHTWYHILGFAAFHVTAIDLTGSPVTPETGYPTAAAVKECKDESKDNKCIFGYFLDDFVDTVGEIDDTGTVPDLGPDTFQNVG